jgi:hypothetical protein
MAMLELWATVHVRLATMHMLMVRLMDVCFYLA